MATYKTDPTTFEDKAEILKAIAHPARLCIVNTLYRTGPSNVTNMHNCLNQPQSTISQHISKLKSAGIIIGSRQGNEIIYSLNSDVVKDIIEILL